MRKNTATEITTQFQVKTAVISGSGSVERLIVHLRNLSYAHILLIQPPRSIIGRKLLASLSTGHIEIDFVYELTEVGSWNEKERRAISSLSEIDCIIAIGGKTALHHIKAALSKRIAPLDQCTLQHIPLYVIPCDIWDGMECQSRYLFGSTMIQDEHTSVSLVCIDRHFLSHKDRKHIPHMMCSALFYVIVSLQKKTHPLIYGWAKSTLDDIAKILSLWKNKEKKEILSLSYLALYKAGICAENRGSCSTSLFLEALTVSGLSQSYQIAASLLQPLMKNTTIDYPNLHTIVEEWISIAQLQPVIEQIHQLSRGCHRLFSHPRTLIALQPLLHAMSPTEEDV